MLDISSTENELLLTLHTERLEAVNVPEFKAALAALPALESRTLVVDLKRVTFLDSSGIGALLGLMMRLNPTPEYIILRHPQPQVANVVGMLRLEKILRLEDIQG